MTVRQTICRYCDLDIEGFAPYPRGQWRDRGGNTHCNDGRHQHWPPAEVLRELRADLRRAGTGTRRYRIVVEETVITCVAHVVRANSLDAAKARVQAWIDDGDYIRDAEPWGDHDVASVEIRVCTELAEPSSEPHTVGTELADDTNDPAGRMHPKTPEGEDA